MAIRIYNTFTGRKEEFCPLQEGRVGIYVCGVTVYDYSHLGHARGAYVFDIIRRYMEYRGFSVTYVRNFTDVDDKIIERANREGITCEELSRRFIDEYCRDMGNLGVRGADIEPKATEHIGDIIDLVAGLVDKGYAYDVDGDVYFRVRKFDAYGGLSGRSPDEMKAGARIDVDEKKEDPLDFALWKSSKPGEPSWDSPWGKGRPGWHIECSAMSMKHLGDTFDIHGGGKDLIFPHHENEIAQSEASTGRTFARYWMHNGFVNVDREKMSKSLGNFFTIREILDKFDAEAVRLFLLSTHYRNPIDFSDRNLSDAVRSLNRFYMFMDEAASAVGAAEESRKPQSGRGTVLLDELDNLRKNFIEFMDDDFNTAAAIGEIFRTTDSFRQAIQDSQGMDSAEIRYLMEEYMKHLGKSGDLSAVLGVFDSTPGEWAGRMDERARAALGPGARAKIESLIEKRKECRSRKDWAGADAIRDELKERGIVLEDGPEGTTWRLEE